MDFFEEQTQARKRTARLGILFGLAVIGIIAAVYVLSLGLYTVAARDATGLLHVAGDLDGGAALTLRWWNPGVFAFACISTGLVVGLGALYKTAQVRAAMDGRDYVIPDDVKALAMSALAHRLIVSPSARIKDVDPRAVVEDVLQSVPVPGARARGTN